MEASKYSSIGQITDAPVFTWVGNIGEICSRNVVAVVAFSCYQII